MQAVTVIIRMMPSGTKTPIKIILVLSIKQQTLKMCYSIILIDHNIQVHALTELYVSITVFAVHFKEVLLKII